MAFVNVFTFIVYIIETFFFLVNYYARELEIQMKRINDFV